MAWIDATYAVTALGQGQAYALGLVTTQSGAYAATARFTLAEASARGIVATSTAFAGYQLPTTLPTDDGHANDVALLQRLTLAVVVRDVYEMVFGVTVGGQNAPPVLGTITRDLENLFVKKLPLVSFETAPANALGGVAWTGGGNPVFRSLRNTGF